MTAASGSSALAEEHGGKVASGGGRPAGFDRGYYFEPTVLDLPDNANPAAQEEIFGPVIGVLAYDDLDDAVRIANDSVYGLSAQVYGADVRRPHRRSPAGCAPARSTSTPSVFSAYAPGGGYKQSGLGRERGPDGIRAFQEVKHMAIGELQADPSTLRPTSTGSSRSTTTCSSRPTCGSTACRPRTATVRRTWSSRRRPRVLGLRGQALPDARA